LKPGLDVISPGAIIFAGERRNGGDGRFFGRRHDDEVMGADRG
jgi:hypothetical protein